MDETNAKLVHKVDELCNTSGERNAEIAIAVVGLPPVAVHALSVEIAEVHEVAVSGTRFSYASPSKSTALHANGTCRACINTCALRMIDLPAPEKRKQCCRLASMIRKPCFISHRVTIPYSIRKGQKNFSKTDNQRNK